MKFRLTYILVALFALAAYGSAQTLSGTVTNATTGKPAGGVAITLISLANGMNEAGNTKSDASGHFSFDLKGETGMPHLVRVNYQNVGYFKMAPPGRNSVELQIYDSAKKLDSISNTVQIMRVQSDGNGLQVLELYAVQNASKPPRTQVPDHSFEFALPEGAVIDEAAARAPNGQPLNQTPNPVAGKKNQYYFDFPLRPGETEFQLAYHLPYSGQATIKPVLLHDVQHFVAMLPKSMQFTPVGAAKFSPMPQEANSNVQVVTNAKAGEEIAFTVSGTGMLADENAQADAQQSGAPGGQVMGGGGPGGGLGKPIDSPDPLSSYRWPLLGVFAVALVAGGFYIVTRRAPTTAEAVVGSAEIASDEPFESERTATPPAKSAVKSKDRSSLLLDAMKEELFQLEIDRQQGRIGEEEYAKAKAALDQTIKRALARAR